MTYTLFIDRTVGTIACVVTLQHAEGGIVIPDFKRLPAASGQSGYTYGGNGDWIRGKGPTPFGTHWMSTKKEKMVESPVGTPFYLFSTVKGSRLLLRGNGDYRENCGLHFDNLWLGSIGCTALRRTIEAQLLFDKLDMLYIQGIEYIKVVVL
jgi:hypothetical protein